MKKMNFQMLLLIDCIGYPDDTIPKELMDNIRYTGCIQEIKAVAFKSLRDLGMYEQHTNLKL